LCEYVVGQVVRSQQVRFVVVMASKREEVCNNVMIAFQMLQSEAMGAVQEDGGQVQSHLLKGFVAHGCWLDLAGLVYPTKSRRIVA
jgi:hypothetical protein